MALRLRLKFQRHILSKSQRLDGLKRSWVLVNTQQQTISDVISNLLHTFDLYDSCPNGILLSMDGFVLPPFESTSILKEKDLICVKRKGAKLVDVIREIRGETALLEHNVEEKQPLISAAQLLANDEFEKEVGGYSSEAEEDEDKEESDVLHEENVPNGDVPVKKRKASRELKSSKTKRQRQALADNDEHVAPKEHGGANADSLNGNGKGAVTPSSLANKTGQSRSARRKKAKRQWLRTIGKAEKEKLLKKQSPEEDQNTDSGSNKDQNLNTGNDHQELQEDSDTQDEMVPVMVGPGHIRFAAPGKEKDVKQKDKAKESFTWNGTISKKKGQKWGKEKQSTLKRNENGVSYEKQSASTWKENGAPNENQSAIERNESRSSKEKKSISRQNDLKNPSTNWTTQEAPPDNGSIDYEILEPLTDTPAEGDIVAYRLLELSSSFCPELTAYRVGKVSWFDPESNRVMLVPVPQYPFDLKKSADDDASEEIPDASFYKEDGSLEIDFQSLVDVRTVKRGEPRPGLAVHHMANGAAASGSGPASSGSGRNTETPAGKDHSTEAWSSRINGTGVNNSACAPGLGWRTETSSSKKNPSPQLQPNSTNLTGMNNPASGPDPGNGSVDAWEEISAALNAKKAELLKEDNWSKNRSKPSWSHRTLRSSALGPTLAFLRAQNGRN